MILKKMIGAMGAHYGFAFEYLFSHKPENHTLRVLDIGAASNPWGGSWITHIADNFVTPETEQQFANKGITVFKVDVEDSLNWSLILDDVEKNGKFDFVICSHTLEDLNNPKIALKMINKIGKAGYISMPSKYAEFTKFETRGGLEGYNGYHHHRWIYQIKNDILIGYPKMNFLEYAKLEEGEVNTTVEIAFIWEDSFDYKLLAPHQLLHNTVGENLLYQLLEKDDLVI